MTEIDKDGSAGTIGNRIKSLRRSVGLSQANLGESLGVTFQQIQKYESGRSKIAADKLQRIAQALNVDVNYFYDTRNGESLPEREARLGQASPTPEGILFREHFDRIKDPRARYLLSELARVLCEIEAGK
ncbi:helix-turn-helix domain-containing protein [Methylobacterium sp. M6A4_1b]